MNFPVFSQLAGNFEVRDEFAPDCFLQQRVYKPPVPQRRPMRWSPVGCVLFRKDSIGQVETSKNNPVKVLFPRWIFAAAACQLLVDERQHRQQAALFPSYLDPEGVGGYRKRCDEVGAKGYEGFALA